MGQPRGRNARIDDWHQLRLPDEIVHRGSLESRPLLDYHLWRWMSAQKAIVVAVDVALVVVMRLRRRQPVVPVERVGDRLLGQIA